MGGLPPRTRAFASAPHLERVEPLGERLLVRVKVVAVNVVLRLLLLLGGRLGPAVLAERDALAVGAGAGGLGLVELFDDGAGVVVLVLVVVVAVVVNDFLDDHRLDHALVRVPVRHGGTRPEQGTRRKGASKAGAEGAAATGEVGGESHVAQMTSLLSCPSINCPSRGR